MGFWYTLFMWVVSFVLTDYFRPSLPKVTPAGTGDFQNPTATNGRYVPLAFGTMRMAAPNVIWYGDFEAVQRTTTTGVIFKKEEGIGFKYELSMALGLCRGKSAGIVGIWIADDKVFDYVVDAASVPQEAVEIDLPDLFGGEDSGGGFQAHFRLHNGSDTQAVSTFLNSRITPLQAYRGFSYVVMSNIAETSNVSGWFVTTIPKETKGANIGESNTCREIRIELQMFDTVANGGLGDVLGLGNDHHFIGRDINPISLAFETWVDTDWGEAMGSSNLNLASFQAAAEILYTEGLGYSQTIDDVQDVSALRDNLEQHIDGYIGPNPVTGEIEVLLSRGGYNPATEFQADATNIVKVEKWSRGEWSETNNEVLLQFADRASDYKDSYAPAQDLANLAIQGRPRSRTVRMPGVHEASMANAIVWRMLKGFSRPVATGTLLMDRTASLLRPGQVIVVTDVEASITDVACRITAISPGGSTEQQVKVQVVEDVFGVETEGFAVPPPSDFIPPTLDVDPFAAVDQWTTEAPFMIVKSSDAPAQHPRILTGARTDTGSGGKLYEYDIVARTGNPPSGTYLVREIIKAQSPGMATGTLRANLTGYEANNGNLTVDVDPIGSQNIDGLIGSYGPGSPTENMGGVAVINPGELDEEWIAFTAATDSGAGIQLSGVWRGVFDSAHQAHTLGDRIWFIFTGSLGIAPDTEALSLDIEVKLLPRSPTDSVLEAAATAISPVIDIQADSRYLRPILPVEMNINSANFSATGDLDSIQVIGAGPAEELAIALDPRLRDWRVEHVIGQMQAGSYPDVWGVDAHEISYWLYDLDVDPTPVRGDAIWSSLDVPTVVVTDGDARVTKEGLRTYMEAANKNTFNARLEVETSHIPFGESVTRSTSRDLMFHDFTVTGLYFIPFGTVFCHLSFDGDVGARKMADKSANNHDVKTIGVDNLIATGVGEPFGNALRTGITDNEPANTQAGMAMPPTGVVAGDLDLNQDWTIEMHVRFETISLDSYFCGRYSISTGADKEWYLWYDASLDSLFFHYTTNDVTQVNLLLETWVPVIDTWYALAVTRKEETDGTLTFRTFIDGVRTNEINTPAFTIFATGVDPAPFEVGITDTLRLQGSGLTGLGHRGYMDEFRLTQGFALYAIDYTVDVAVFEPEHGDYIIAQSNFIGEAGTDTLNLGEEFWASRIAWFYDGSTAQCKISSTKAKFGFTSLFIDGSAFTDSGLNYGSFEPAADQVHQKLLDRDFTIEGWVNFDALPSTRLQGMCMAGCGDNGASQREWRFGFSETDELEFAAFWPTGATENEITATTTPVIAINTWYFIAVCREGTRIQAWIGATRVIDDATFFDDGGSPASIFKSSTPLTVGKAYRDETADLTRAMDGYVDSIRITKWQARYTGATITVPTAAFPTPYISEAPLDHGFEESDVYFHSHFNFETSVIDPHWKDVISLLDMEETDTATSTTDEGSIGSTWTFNNNAQIDTAQKAVGTASLLLDGVADYLSTPDHADWQPATTSDPFTVECWVRFNGAPAGGGNQVIMSKWLITGAQRSWKLWFDDSDDHLAFNWSTNGTNDAHVSVAWSPATATWYHVAAVTDGLDVSLWIDGVQIGSFTNNSLIFNSTSEVRIGAQNVSGTEEYFNGWIDDVRVTRTARFPTLDAYSFAVQTAAHPEKMGGEYPRDEGPTGHQLEFYNDPLIDLTQKKFGTASLYLDGVDQYATLGDGTTPGGAVFGFDDFTIELFVRFDGDPLTANMTFVSEWDTTSSRQGYILALRNNELVFEWNDGAVDTTTTGTWNPATATWYHVAVSKHFGITRLFVDGTQVGTDYEATSTTRAIDNPTTVDTTIGCHFIASVATDLFNGWIDEVRIIKGRARYTANFTAPTDEFNFHRNVFLLGMVEEDIYRQGTPGDRSRLAATPVTATQNYMVNLQVQADAPYFPEIRPDGRFQTSMTGGPSGRLSFVHDDEQNLRNQDFTIEAWVLFNSNNPTTENFGICSKYDATGNNRSWFLRYDSVLDALQFGWYLDGSTLKDAYFDWSGVLTDTWYHIAITREGDTLRMFLDGTLQTLNAASDTLGADESFFVVSEEMSVASIDYSAGTDAFEGLMEDLRIVAGKALYTSTFTLNTDPLPYSETLLP